METTESMETLKQVQETETETSTDENKNENMPEEDPFKVRLKYSTADYLWMIFLGLTLVPVRVIVASLALVLSWAISSFGLYNMDSSRPISGWRKPLQRFTCFLGQICCRCCGFSVSRKGQQVPASVAPVLVVAPHSSFFDALVVFWCGLPFIINREENKNIPFIGKCVQFGQSIFVRRELKSSREDCKAEIKRRVDPEGVDRWKQFLIFPEGTTTNRRALMSFKPGGFLPGQPVQPILVHYHLPPHKDTVSWTWDQPHGFVKCFLFTMCTWKTEVELEFLPVYTPDETEVQDPVMYANNVRKVMGEALQVPLCDLTFEDIKNKFSSKKKD